MGYIEKLKVVNSFGVDITEKTEYVKKVNEIIDIVNDINDRLAQFEDYVRIEIKKLKE